METQKTEKENEIPIPNRSDFLGNLKKAATLEKAECPRRSPSGV
jgi:hypothetical protein